MKHLSHRGVMIKDEVTIKLHDLFLHFFGIYHIHKASISSKSSSVLLVLVRLITPQGSYLQLTLRMCPWYFLWPNLMSTECFATTLSCFGKYTFPLT